DSIDLESEYIRGERNVLIHQCIKALKDDYAQVLFLVYFEDFSNTEAAKVMSKSQRQITQLLYRAKNALKEEMERREKDGQI
ncbi:MAG: RNA polymerase subunit sigma-24, partial [Ruminococcus sp.]|nr:RNA polymerase subunit sigma-24 [Ruminococcus sp.]